MGSLFGRRAGAGSGRGGNFRALDACRAVLFAIGVAAVSPRLLAAPPRLRLLADAEVKSHEITLKDLLPPEAPAALLAQALRIRLGSAPQATSIRRLSKEEIQNALVDAPELLAAVEIPDVIRVRRYHRALTPAELVAALDAALGRFGRLDPRSLGLDSLALRAPVYVTTDDPGLQVTQIEFDSLHRRTTFRLWTSKEPQNLPFYITLSSRLKFPALVATRDLAPGEVARASDFAVATRARSENASLEPPAAASLVGLEARQPVRAGDVVERSMFAPELMAQPGLPAKLTIAGNGFRIETTVIPLERGYYGQQIRVRDPDTRRVMAAEVVGKGQLRGNL
jgi:flagella basal body P-ring formation protein FlgA